MEHFEKLKRVMKAENNFNQDLFRATMSAVGRMESTFTKTEAIKSASKKYKVPQSEIKRLIEKMNVKSRRSQIQKSNPLFREQALNEVAFAQRMRQES